MSAGLVVIGGVIITTGLASVGIISAYDAGYETGVTVTLAETMSPVNKRYCAPPWYPNIVDGEQNGCRRDDADGGETIVNAVASAGLSKYRRGCEEK